ncbi:MAG TPA: response regulator [Proteobacteria bacterium]|nr:response regulator [Pseudomonadota bacterium]
MTKEPEIAAKRILVMDDDDAICEILSELLCAYGCEVVAVGDGRQALEIYQQQHFDLVIMDLTIPGGLGGRETIKLLRACDPQVKAVVSSGYNNDPVLADYKRHGFCGVLNKPYIVEDLQKLLHRVMT